MIGKLINLEKHGDERGELIAIESFSNEVDFEIKRVYYLYGTVPGMIRGLHAHKKLKQIIICTSGSCVIRLDNGTISEEVVLNRPDVGLVIDNNVWREMYNN